MNRLYIDVETYSSADIWSVGAYKYCESLDFEILLIAYAFNDEPVQIVDFNEPLPPELKQALTDPYTEKHAHNATFERLVFRAVGIDVPAEQWLCSMVKAAYCGYPLSLMNISKAMDLSNGKQASGAGLINYFCKPVKPTKANGGRSRNFPINSELKWNAFKEYCIMDVRASREIETRLRKYEIPESEKQNYIFDQKINDRGVLVDLKMAENAVILSNEHANLLKNKMISLTGLENPNSLKQLKEWLSNKLGKEISSLTAETVPMLIADSTDELIKEVLTLRLKSSKTSVKKYVAMLNSAGADNRARGLFQFYGATRTGRWAGRLIQLQNLPRNKIEPLSVARHMVRDAEYGDISLMYNDISSILSQTIRTALIPKKNNLFAVTDFSSVEARILAWLAGETWRIEVFNSHGKIYEASAALMFKTDISKVTAAQRQKGKIAELALGYQGSVGAMSKMGGDKIFSSDKDMASMVRRWRRNNKNIVTYWVLVERAVLKTLKSKKPVRVRNVMFFYNGSALQIKLPSGRSLFYQEIRLHPNKWGQESVQYRSSDSTARGWVWVDSYGGKFTENICQAISRDLLAEALKNLEREGLRPIMHVHDEVICEVPERTAKESLSLMNRILSVSPMWASDLKLTANGYVFNYYKKD